MLIQLLSWVDRLAPHRRLIHVLASIFTAALVVVFVLDYGHWTRTEVFQGPFKRSADDAGQYVVPIGTDIPFLSIPSPLPGEVSTIQLWVNGRSFNRTEAPEPSIEQGKLWGIRGLYRTLRFSLPPAVPNDAGTSLKVEYQIRMHRTVDNLIAFGAKTLIILAGIIAYRLGNVGWMRWLVGCTAGLMLPPMRLASWALILACVFYAGTIIYGLASGDALPTATVFRLIPASRLVTQFAPFAPLAMIAFAIIGAVLAWFAWLGLVRADAVRQFELGQIRLWRTYGLPVLLALFLFVLSAGGWSGYVHTTDMNYMSIAGLVPHSDGGAYYVGTFHLSYFGTWESVGTRRPMAAAFRQLITVAAGYSFTGTLLVQLAIMALALYLASSLLARWYGVWAGIGFAGLAFNIARPFLSTTMTEPLAYIWALFSLVFFIQSVRKHSLPHALVGLAALTVGLLMRMGALFAIPFMVLWIGFAFAKETVSRVRLMVLAAAVVGAVVTVNFGLKHYYGEQGVDLGDNFAMVACGLSLGEDWNGCTKPYEAPLSSLPNEHAVSAFLYTKAWENFLAHPSVLIGQLWANCSQYIHFVLSFMFAGYIALYDSYSTEVSDLFLLAFLAGIFYVWRDSPATEGSFSILMLANILYVLYGSYSTVDLFLLALLAGIIYVWRNTSATERSFWIAMLASIPPSAAMVMTADGWRALHVTHVFVAAFLVLGLAAPLVAYEKSRAPTLNWQLGAAALAASMLLFLLFPVMAHSLALRELRMHPPLPPREVNKEIVPGGRRLSGFLVIPDDEQLPRAVPALHASEFAKLIRKTKLEDDFGPFLDRVMPHLPFAFVGTGRMDGPNDTNRYIAPPEVLWRKDVWAWRFTTRSWAPGEKPWYYLQDVVAAEPLP